MSEPDFPTDDERAAGDFEIGYMCVFCGQTIADDARDFCELNFSVGGGFGTFTCHVGCFRDRSHDPSTFPDLLTPAERPLDYVEPSPELIQPGTSSPKSSGSYMRRNSKRPSKCEPSRRL